MNASIVKIGLWTVAMSDEEPTAAFEVNEWLTWQESSSDRTVRPQAARFVIEIKRPLGGHNNRALLGGELRSFDGAILLRVAQSSPMGVGGRASCRSRLGSDLVPGLPPEFAKATMRTLSQQVSSLGSCEVIVDRAAYDEVDSSASAFDRASQLLFSLLSAQVDPSDEKSLERVVSSW